MRPRHRILLRLFACFLLAGVTACANEPIKVNASKPVLEAVSQGQLIYGKNQYTPWGFGVCYGKRLNASKQVLSFAQESCGNGRIELRDEDQFWNDCPLFQAARASFVCYPKGPIAPGS